MIKENIINNGEPESGIKSETKGRKGKRDKSVSVNPASKKSIPVDGTEIMKNRERDETLDGPPGDRPKKLDDFIGQDDVRKQLHIYLESAKKQRRQLDHILFYGPAGLGKTTLATIAAEEMGSNIRIISAPTIEKGGDLAAMLSSLREGDFLFIDEIHRLKINLEEILFPAMEDFRLDIIIGKGPTAKSLRINLPPFTLIGATTLAGNISKPLRSRFGIILKLDYYEVSALTEIILRAFARHGVKVDAGSAQFLAGCARGTPRIALRLVRRVIDYAVYHDCSSIGLDIVMLTLREIGITGEGLDRNDIRLLTTVVEDYCGGPVGVNALAVSISEDPQTVEDFYEPFLIQKGYLRRTTKGRMATRKAFEYLGKKLPVGNSELF